MIDLDTPAPFGDSKTGGSSGEDKIPDNPQIGGGVSGAVSWNQGDFV